MKTKNTLLNYGLSLLTIGAAVFAALAQVHAADAADKQPNVVLMLADNVGWGDIGAYGGGAFRGMPTPNLDKLASEGMQMTQFLVEPGCTPSRAALMTGRYSIRAGLGTIIIGGTPSTLRASEVTLAEVLKSNGYATGMTGKWHLGGEEQSWPTRQGFDEYHVGVLETTDSTLYRKQMERVGLPEELIKKSVPGIWESDADGTLKWVREYTVDYRRQVEGDIAKASVDYIKRQAKTQKPFFLYVGWTHTHYPNVCAPEFTGKSSHAYGDCVMELDYRTGQVLDAIKEAGIEDNTIVIWLSDNSATPTLTTPPDAYWGGNNGPFRGELGDALEGSIRTVGMIKWPGKIKPGKNNEMVSIHDFLPTLAAIAGAELPKDRPYDGVDQSAFFLGKQPKSNRESLITFVENEIAAVRWRNFRMYPKAFTASFDRPSQEGLLGLSLPKTGGPDIYNIEADPRELNNIAGTHAWLFGPYMRTIAEYNQSLKQHPNPPGVNLTGTEFGK